MFPEESSAIKHSAPPQDLVFKLIVKENVYDNSNVNIKESQVF